MPKGLAVSPGVSIGVAYCIEQIFVNPNRKALAPDEVTPELARFSDACQRVAEDLERLQHKVAAQVSVETAAVFSFHQTLLNDPEFQAQVRNQIVHEFKPATAALADVVEHYGMLLARSGNKLITERASDLRDVALRISQYLSEVLHADLPVLEGPLIIIAHELLPSQVVTLGDRLVAGIVTATGSSTSHAAIVARSRSIPAVSGVRDITRQTKTGDVIVVDGRDGFVQINPDAATLDRYRRLEHEFAELRHKLITNLKKPAVTADGMPLNLYANINNAQEARAAAELGAAGVGLYRTEYLYLTHPDVPDEEEQTEAYLNVIRAMPHVPVTIRTLDIGGDKSVPYLGHGAPEANPFLGWRSIRLSFEMPDFFATQLRAILRAAADAGPEADVRVMFPMVTNLEELVYLRTIVARCSRELRSAGVDVVPVKLGMMVEVPAAALAIDHLIEKVDFVSIGSNDLVQYMMAADRDNPKVNHLCQPLAPPVLRVLKRVIDAAHRVKKPVSLCGEMAGQPDALVVLLGMGLTDLSMSPALIPSIKTLAAKIEVRDAQRILRRLWRMRTASEVKATLRRYLNEIAPDLDLLMPHS